MNQNSRIYVAGHRGLVGSAIVATLKKKGYSNLIFKTRSELDLVNQAAVNSFFEAEQIEYVFLAAAKVGGIQANSDYQADFLFENLAIATNVIQAAHLNGTKKLVFLGSSCIYPKNAPQPLKEEYLLTGPLEQTNEGYAIAKIAGLKLCEMYHRQYGKRFISVMPTNLYGPGDNFHPLNSHVIPGMMRRFHEAKTVNADHVQVWGSGLPMREFLHAADLAEAMLLIMHEYEDVQTLNIGTGTDCTIADLAHTMKLITGYQGNILFDSSKPDGTLRKVLDVSRIYALGWRPKHSLRDGLEQTYLWALQNKIFS